MTHAEWARLVAQITAEALALAERAPPDRQRWHATTRAGFVVALALAWRDYLEPLDPDGRPHAGTQILAELASRSDLARTARAGAN